MWIWGAGGHAKVVRYLLDNGLGPPCYDGVPIHVIDDADNLRKWQAAYKEEYGIIAIGNNRTRLDIAIRINHAKYTMRWATSATVAEPIRVSVGTVIMPQAAINPDTAVGRHVIINTGATVDHDCFISDFVHIAPGAHLCGGVQVEEGTLIGAGTVVTPGVRIGPWLTIPAGSVVTRDTPDETALASIRGRRNQGGN